jgi:GNAT superfamily N-acetyltransferase
MSIKSMRASVESFFSRAASKLSGWARALRLWMFGSGVEESSSVLAVVPASQPLNSSQYGGYGTASAVPVRVMADVPAVSVIHHKPRLPHYTYIGHGEQFCAKSNGGLKASYDDMLVAYHCGANPGHGIVDFRDDQAINHAKAYYGYRYRELLPHNEEDFAQLQKDYPHIGYWDKRLPATFNTYRVFVAESKVYDDSEGAYGWRIAGVAVLEGESDKVVALHDLKVKPVHRFKGVGSMLMRYIRNSIARHAILKITDASRYEMPWEDTVKVAAGSMMHTDPARQFSCDASAWTYERIRGLQAETSGENRPFYRHLNKRDVTINVSGAYECEDDDASLAP